MFTLIATVTLAASYVQSVTGCGFGIIAMIFLPSLLLYTEANVLASILGTLTSVVILVVTFRKVNWKNLCFPLIGCLIANYVAITFIKTQKNDTLMLFLGVALVALSVYFFFFSNRLNIKPSWQAGLVAGVISGVMSGMFSIGGPPAVIYYMQSEEDSDRYLATLSAFFVFSGLISIGMKIAYGFVTLNVWIGLAVGTVGMLLGAFLGSLTRSKTKPQSIKKTVYAVMALSGVVNVVTSLI